MEEQPQSWDDVARRQLQDEASRGDDAHSHVVVAGASEGTAARVRGMAALSTYTSGPPPAPRLEVRDGGRGPWVAVAADGSEKVLIERGEGEAHTK